jgi:hypothetical protein
LFLEFLDLDVVVNDERTMTVITSGNVGGKINAGVTYMLVQSSVDTIGVNGARVRVRLFGLVKLLICDLGVRPQIGVLPPFPDFRGHGLPRRYPTEITSKSQNFSKRFVFCTLQDSKRI